MQDTLSVVYQSCFSERNKLEVFQSVLFSTSTPLRSLGKSMLISMSSSEGSTALKLPSSLGSLVWRIMIGTAIPNFNLHVSRSLNTTCFCSANQNDHTRLVLFGSAFSDRISHRDAVEGCNSSTGSKSLLPGISLKHAGISPQPFLDPKPHNPTP